MGFLAVVIMKKLIIGVFTALLVIGCAGPVNISETISTAKCDDGATIYARKFIFEEHQYIEFTHHRVGHNNTGFVHDPNCWCMVDLD